MKYDIPVCDFTLPLKSLEYAAEAIAANQLSWRGEFVGRFESEFANWLGVSHAVAVDHGGSALILALKACGVGPGDEVIVPDLAYVAVANAVLHVGARPVFVDADPGSWNISHRGAAQAVTDRTRAIIVVHTLGNPCEMEDFCSLAGEHRLWLIEDACEGLGGGYGMANLGTWGDIGVFSFYANKPITCGEGGMVVTGSERLAERVRSLSTEGRAPCIGWQYERLAWNMRMTNVQAALLCGQLEGLDLIIGEKRRVFETYGELLGVQQHVPLDDTHSCWMFGYDCGKTRAVEVAEILAQHGVETRPMFSQLSTQEHLDPGGWAPYEREAARKLAKHVIILPTYPDMTRAQIEKVAGLVKEAVK